MAWQNQIPFGEREVKMKKTLFVMVLVVALMTLVIPVVSASWDYDDPALCVNGQWLLVDAAAPSGIQVVVPDDAVYGNKEAGHCAQPAPVTGVITKVKEGDADHLMTVWVAGSVASKPTITVSYGNTVRTKPNTGRLMMFLFYVR
jgi:hypothetical protein